MQINGQCLCARNDGRYKCKKKKEIVCDARRPKKKCSKICTKIAFNVWNYFAAAAVDDQNRFLTEKKKTCFDQLASWIEIYHTNDAEWEWCDTDADLKSNDIYYFLDINSSCIFIPFTH